MGGVGAAGVPTGAEGGGGPWQPHTHPHCEHWQAQSLASRQVGRCGAVDLPEAMLGA
jgi:hypothetical protein